MRAIAPSGATLQCRCIYRGHGPLLQAAQRRGHSCPRYHFRPIYMQAIQGPRFDEALCIWGQGVRVLSDLVFFKDLRI